LKLGVMLIVGVQLILLLGSSCLIVFGAPALSPSAMSPSDYNRCEVLGEQTVTNPMRLHCLVAPSDDAFIENLTPTKTFGDMPILIVQTIPSIPTLRDYAYLKFDLTNAVPSQLIQSHAKPNNANLSMYVEWINFFYNASIQIHHVTSNDWDERSITWNNPPVLDLEVFSQTIVRMNDTWAHWDVTSSTLESLKNSSQISFAAIASERSWKNQVWFASKEYPLDRGLRWPALELTYLEPILTIVSPVPNLTLNVDDGTFQTDAGGVFRAPFPWGNHHVRVPDGIPTGNGTRMGFRGWSDNDTESDRTITLGNNLTIGVDYGKQYKLETVSPYGSSEGSGWYAEGSTANVSLQPTAIPHDGWLGLLGVRHVFDHLTGSCETSDPNCSVRMDGPKSVIAVWRDDYLLPILIALVTIGVLVFVKQRRSDRRRRRLQR
jgi:hypothetical protein